MSMFGDVSVISAIVLTLLSMALCVIYGFLKWNKDDYISPEEAKKEKHWDDEEEHINRELDTRGGSR